jgi:hypothetical protein
MNGKKIALLRASTIAIGLAMLHPLSAHAQLRTTSTRDTTGTLTTTGGTSTLQPSTTGYQTPLPPGPEAEAGCTVPTLSMCQDLAYLATRCGVLQLENAWTCSVLVPGELPSYPSTIAYSIHASGVSEVIPGGSAEGAAECNADPGSIDSNYVCAEHGNAIPGLAMSGLVARNPYTAWAMGSDFRSCHEYVYERYFELHELLRALGPDARDPLRVLQVAFGPAGASSSFGTNHLFDRTVHARDGSPTWELPYSLDGTDAKNAFFWLPPTLGTTELQDPGPGLHDVLRTYSSIADTLLDQIAASRAADAPGTAHYASNVYPQELHRDYWWWMNVLYEGPTPGLIAPPPVGDLYFDPEPWSDANLVNFDAMDDLAIEDDGVDSARELLGHVPGHPEMRRYLRAELDELFEVQERVRELVRVWRDLNFRFAGSGWSPSVLAGQGPSADPVGGLTTGAQQLGPSQAYTSQSPSRGGGTLVLNTGTAPSRESSETALRRAVLSELVALLRVGSRHGCLAPGLTPCDWSPAELRRRLLRSIEGLRRQDYATCQRLADSIWRDADVLVNGVPQPAPPTLGLMMNVLGRTYRYHDTSCEVSVPATLTHAQLMSTLGAIEACRDAQAEAAQADALDAIRESTDLYDEATGEVRNPGFWRSGGESMGNDWFSVGYDYTYGWELDLSEGVCSADAAAGGHFGAQVDLLSRFPERAKTVSLIDLTARLDTDHTTNEGTLLELSASVFGVPLFTPIEIEGGAPAEPRTFNGVREGSRGIDVGVTVPFVIVFVPVTIEAGVAAELGFRSSLYGEAVGFGDHGQCPQIRLQGELEPFARARGFVTAAVELLVARAGIRGEITLLEASLPFRPSLTLASDFDLDLQAGAASADLTLYVDTEALLRVRTLDGEISAYAEVGWPPLDVRGSITLIQWSGPRWETPLYRRSYEIPLATLAVAFGGQ